MTSIISSNGNLSTEAVIPHIQPITKEILQTFINSVVAHDFPKMKELYDIYGKKLNVTLIAEKNLLHVFFENSFGSYRITRVINEKSRDCLKLLVELGVDPFDTDMDFQTKLST